MVEGRHGQNDPYWITNGKISNATRNGGRNSIAVRPGRKEWLPVTPGLDLAEDRVQLAVRRDPAVDQQRQTRLVGVAGTTCTCTWKTSCPAISRPRTRS